jgi:hypothetical protein
MAFHSTKNVDGRADILIATPILDPMVSSFHVDGLLDVYLNTAHKLQNNKIKVRFARHHAFQRDIVRARSRLARQLLESPCTHLLFIDGDNVPNSDALAGMLRADRDVVACPYPRREIHPPLKPGDLSSCLRYSYIPWEGAKTDHRECVQIKGIGFGFILIKREVVEHLYEACKWHVPDAVVTALNGSDLAEDAKDAIRLALRNTFVDDFPGNDNKETTALFSLVNTVDGKMLGEDYSFCARCFHEDIKIFMYLGKGSPVEHDGMMRFGQTNSPGVVHDGGEQPLPLVGSVLKPIPQAEEFRSDDG